MRPIDADALYLKHKSHADLFKGSEIHDDIVRRDEATMALAEILNAPTIEADIDRAEILRLCNEIEDIVSEISKLSENYLIYSDCKSILDRTKAIGKELTGNEQL